MVYLSLTIVGGGKVENLPDFNLDSFVTVKLSVYECNCFSVSQFFKFWTNRT